jgi:hypothetical protein
LQCRIQSLRISFQGTQCIPDHSITPPLAHISPRGDFSSQGVHLLPTEKFILFLEKIILGGGMPIFLIEKFFPFFGETTHPGECPFSLPRSAFRSLREPLPGECPFSPLKSSFHFSREPFHGECPFSPREPLHVESSPISLQMHFIHARGSQCILGL